MNLIQNIIHRATQHYKFNVLILPLNGEYENLLAKTDNNFWCVPQLSLFKITQDFSEKINIIGVQYDMLNLPDDIVLDCIIVHDRTKQYDIIKKLSTSFRIPIVIVEHKDIRDYPPNVLNSTQGIEVYSNQKNMYQAQGLNHISYPDVNEKDFIEKWQNIFVESQRI